MPNYSIFLVNSEFANHYYYRSEILYRFLRKFDVYPVDSINYKQSRYVTSEIPVRELMDYLALCHSGENAFEKKGNVLRIEGQSDVAELLIAGTCIYGSSSSFSGAEKLLFQYFRRFNSRFFIIEYDSDNYGWISPIGKRHKDLNTRLLYSLL
ncbi:sporulation inhibitor of replication protein SirA [Sediminibacillus dalangtanensis]|uniref:Sporulation inhibitor of replication protein SirA n=1 Tax=Sediminibacillus dalangtanensis TaxID=2729421 RepID=A0ABX7VSM5_9BACI|nr:sporulation inhibitor of replication protein SirA [Sediminibacillus dalangtanensis]QTM99503.1 sporulation inhibitor of replication protein SirA [Sediminibacillus dalangtanensis]